MGLINGDHKMPIKKLLYIKIFVLCHIYKG